MKGVIIPITALILISLLCFLFFRFRQRKGRAAVDIYEHPFTRYAIQWARRTLAGAAPRFSPNSPFPDVQAEALPDHLRLIIYMGEANEYSRTLSFRKPPSDCRARRYPRASLSQCEQMQLISCVANALGQTGAFQVTLDGHIPKAYLNFK